MIQRIVIALLLGISGISILSVAEPTDNPTANPIVNPAIKPTGKAKTKRTERRVSRKRIPEREWDVVGAYATTLIQTGTWGVCNAPLLAWSPEFHLAHSISLILDAGGSYLTTADTHFLAFYLDLRGKIYLSKTWAFDGGIGTQNWGGQGGWLLMPVGGFSYHFSKPVWNILRNARAGFDYVAHPDFRTYQIFLGLEFSLGGLL